MEVYRSIGELPVFIFDSINKSGDFTLLVKDKKKYSAAELEKVWEIIYDEFIKEFGISEQFLSYLSQMKLAIGHYIQAYINNDMAAINLAKARVNDANEIFKQGSKAPNNIYAIVSKYMGFRINPSEISTREFYQYLKLATTNPDNAKKD